MTFRTTNIKPSGRVASTPGDSIRGWYPTLLNNLIGYWELEEASGTRNDSHGANHLTDTNTVTQGVGVVGNAALYTRANSETLVSASNAALQTGDIDLTLACWVKFNTKPGSMGMMCKDNNGGEPNNREYQLQYANSSGKFVFQVSGNGTATAGRFADTFGTPPLDTWMFVVGWHNSVLNTINIQVNNGGVDTTAHTTGIFVGTNDFRLGSLGTTNYLDGLLDQCGLWKRVLTPVERAWLYNAGAGRSYSQVQEYRDAA